MADRRRPLVAALVFVVAVLVAGAHPASAQAVTGGEFQALVERAATDARALSQLRAVREVDGRPVDVGRALGGAEGPELAARLQALAQGPAGQTAGTPAAEVRDEAASILEGRRFQPPRVPRPFQGALRTLGRWLEPAGDPFQAAWRWIERSLPAQIAVVTAVFAGALLISMRLVGRRAAQAVQRSRVLGVDTGGLDPDELERRAAAAEGAGDLDHAVRLRFVAGVLRLDQAGAIAYRSSLTTGQLTATVPSRSFAALAGTFDEIAYGGRPADPSDVEATKVTWPEVLAEAGR